MRKRRTREHVIADLSVNHVERLVLRCGWTAERTRHDYGLDLVMRSYSASGEIENGTVWLQLKATDHCPWTRDKRAIPVRLQWRDLLSWVNDPMPVILVIYDAVADRAFWLHVQEYFRAWRWAERARTAATVTVHVPAGQVLDEAAVRRFAGFRDECLRRP
jgi:hypothetical protein